MNKLTKILSHSAMGAIAIGLASSSMAATITYTLTGNGTATIGATTQSGAFTATGIGDTANVTFPFGGNIPIVPLSSFAVAFGTNVYTATNAIRFFDNRNVSIAGFTDTTTQDIFDFTSVAFAAYNSVSNIGPIAVGTNFTSVIATNAGALTFANTSLTNLSFRAVTGAVTPVPEAATWTMMIAGFGLAGVALRRRSKVRVTFA